MIYLLFFFTCIFNACIHFNILILKWLTDILCNDLLNISKLYLAMNILVYIPASKLWSICMDSLLTGLIPQITRIYLSMSGFAKSST